MLVGRQPHGRRSPRGSTCRSLSARGCSAVGQERSPVARRELGRVLREARVEVREPLAVDERLEDAAHLVRVRGVRHGAKEAQLDHATHVGLDAVARAGLVARLGQEHADQVHDLVARQDQAGVTALGVELREPLAQQSEQQAHVERQLAPRDEARDERAVALVLGLRTQVRVPLGLVDHDLEAERRDEVPRLRLEREQVAPRARAGLAVDHALDERGHDERQLGALAAGLPGAFGPDGLLAHGVPS
ncbi:hypothetical protein D3C74_338860 [compost metagenome]